MPRASGMRIAGVVIEVHRRRAVVLAEGRFLSVRAVSGWAAGQEVWLSLGPLVAGERLRRAVTGAIAAAGTAVVVLTGGAVAAAVPVAVVSVDLNPGVQFAVNHWARVVRVTAVGPAGGVLLRRLGPLDHRSLAAAISEIVDEEEMAAPGTSAGRAAPAVSATAGAGQAHTVGGAAKASGRAHASSAPAGGSPNSAAAGTKQAPSGSAGTRVGGSEGVGSGWPTTVLIAAAPLHGGQHRLPPAVAHQVASAAGAVRGILARQHLPSAMVAVVHGGAADVRAAKRDSVTLGDYMLARELGANGVRVTPQAFVDKPIAAVLAEAGASRAAVLEALGGPPAPLALPHAGTRTRVGTAASGGGVAGEAGSGSDNRIAPRPTGNGAHPRSVGARGKPANGGAVLAHPGARDAGGPVQAGQGPSRRAHPGEASPADGSPAPVAVHAPAGPNGAQDAGRSGSAGGAATPPTVPDTARSQGMAASAQGTGSPGHQGHGSTATEGARGQGHGSAVTQGQGSQGHGSVAAEGARGQGHGSAATQGKGSQGHGSVAVEGASGPGHGSAATQGKGSQGHGSVAAEGASGPGHGSAVTQGKGSQGHGSVAVEGASGPGHGSAVTGGTGSGTEAKGHPAAPAKSVAPGTSGHARSNPSGTGRVVAAPGTAEHPATHGSLSTSGRTRWPGVRLPAWLVGPLTQPQLRGARSAQAAGVGSARSTPPATVHPGAKSRPAVPAQGTGGVHRTQGGATRLTPASSGSRHVVRPKRAPAKR